MQEGQQETFFAYSLFWLSLFQLQALDNEEKGELEQKSNILKAGRPKGKASLP